MKRMLLLFAMTLTTIAGAGIATAETATADAPFRFELAQTDSHRGLGVEGTSTTASRGESAMFGCESRALTQTGR